MQLFIPSSGCQRRIKLTGNPSLPTFQCSGLQSSSSHQDTNLGQQISLGCSAATNSARFACLLITAFTTTIVSSDGKRRHHRFRKHWGCIGDSARPLPPSLHLAPPSLQAVFSRPYSERLFVNITVTAGGFLLFQGVLHSFVPTLNVESISCFSISDLGPLEAIVFCSSFRAFWKEFIHQSPVVT